MKLNKYDTILVYKIAQMIHPMAIEAAAEHLPSLVDNPADYFTYSDFAADIAGLIQKCANDLGIREK